MARKTKKSKRRATSDTSRHDPQYPVERYKTRNHRRSLNTMNCHQSVGQNHIARRRALATDAKTMAAIFFALVSERDREDNPYLTAQTKAKPCGTCAKKEPLVSRWSHPGSLKQHEKQTKQMERVLVIIPACSHERPERHSHRELRTTVYRRCTECQFLHVCAGFVSSSENSNRMTFRSSAGADVQELALRACWYTVVPELSMCKTFWQLALALWSKCRSRFLARKK